MSRSGTSPRAARLRRYFVTPSRTFSDDGIVLQSCDELVVEERHAHLERMRHRGAVEVVEHVVDEPELGVENERGRERRPDAPGTCATARAACRAAVQLGERAARRALRRRSRVDVARQREVACCGVSRADRPCRPAEPCRDAGRRAAQGAARRPRQHRPPLGDRRRAMAPVPAQQLVRALARQRHCHVLPREPAERDEADRGEVGERLVEMPDELSRSTSCRRSGARAHDGRCRTSRPPVARRRARCSSARPAKPTENVLTGSVTMLGHQRDDQARVETAGEHRAERDVAHQPKLDRLAELGEKQLAPFLFRPPATGDGSG